MIKPEQVPTECLIAYAEAHKTGGIPAGIAAALNAWPGMQRVSEVFTAGGDFYRPHIILPLPQEAGDE